MLIFKTSTDMYRTMHQIIGVKYMDDKCWVVGVYKHSDNIS